MPHIAVLRILQILSYAVWRCTLSGFRRELNLEPVAFTVRNTATQKNAFSVFNDISFLWIKFGSLPPTPRRGALVSHKKRHLERSYCLFKRNFRGALRLAPQKHSRLARLKRFAILLVSSLVRLASSAPRRRFGSLPPTPRRGALVSHKKRHPERCLFLWRRRGDSNSRAGYPTYALSRGASSPTWVLLHW